MMNLLYGQRVFALKSEIVNPSPLIFFAPVTGSGGNRFRGRGHKVGVVAAFRGAGAEILRFVPLRFQVGDELFLQGVGPMVAADGNFHNLFSSLPR